MCHYNLTPAQKLRDYEETLEFIQDELKSERVKLVEAKKNRVASEIIEMIEQNIIKMEIGTDRYQSWIQVLKNNLPENES